MIRQSVKMLLPLLIVLLLDSSVQQVAGQNTATSGSSSSVQTSNSSTVVVTNSSTVVVTNSSTVVTNSSTVVTNSSTVIVVNNGSCSTCGNSTSNSTKQWPAIVDEWLSSSYKWTIYISFQKDVQLTVYQWLQVFSQAQQATAGIAFNYTECKTFVTSKQELKCDYPSIIQAASVVIMNILEALKLKPAERTQVCLSLEESVKVFKSIRVECQKDSLEDWNKYRMAKFNQHLAEQYTDVFRTSKRLICSPFQDSSEVTVPDGTCDMVKIRNHFLAFYRLDMFSDNGAGCSDASLVIEAIESTLESCLWEVRSSLLVLVSKMQNHMQTMCTASTCNIGYVESLLTDNFQLLEDIDNITKPLAPIVSAGLCSNLKFVLAISANYTSDCSRNIYNSVSKRIGALKDEYVKRCGPLPQEPKPCVRSALNPHDIILGLAKSFFPSKELVCQTATKLQVKDKAVDSYCTGTAPKPEAVLLCLSNTAISTSPCDRSSWPIIDQLQKALPCLYSVGLDDISINRTKSFLDLLQTYLPFKDINPLCAAEDTFDRILFNATLSFLNSEQDPSFCLNVQDHIDQWLKTCGNSKLNKNNIIALLSLACHKTLQLPAGCSYSGCSTCFSTATLASNASQMSTVQQCVQTAVTNCSEVFSLAALEAWKYLAAAADIISPPVNDSNCVCQPFSAVICYLDLSHGFKQITPDYQGLCPKVKESDTCSRSYIQGCTDECTKSTASNIIHKFKNKFEEICHDPPETVCPAVSALQCVTDLDKFWESSEKLSNNTICIKITIAQECVFDKIAKCDALTAVAISRQLQFTINKFKNPDCKPPEDQFKACFEVFEENIKKIEGMNKDDVLTALQNKNDTLWKKLVAQCEELDFASSCINATLGLKGNKSDAVIVRITLDAVYVDIKKLCIPPPKLIQCYACDGDSCVNGTTNKTCNENEPPLLPKTVSGTKFRMGKPKCPCPFLKTIAALKGNHIFNHRDDNKECWPSCYCTPFLICVTTTSVNQNGTTVKQKGCSARTECKPGCDPKGCTYCCSENLCNNLENGPTATCNLEAAASCGLKLSSSYVNKTFACREVDVLTSCIASVKFECEIGGSYAAIAALANLDLRLEKEQCLIEEANQTCTVTQMVTVLNYVKKGSLSKDNLCWLVSETRSKVKDAEDQCTKEQAILIKQCQADVEVTIGQLNCTQDSNVTISNVTISNQCKPVDASLLCSKKVLGNANPKTGLTCQQYSDIVACMKPLLSNCSSPTQLLFVNDTLESLKTFLPPNTVCTNVTLVDGQNQTMNKVTDCLQKFLIELKGNCICTLFKKTKELLSCLLNISAEAILTLEITEKIQLENILDAVDKIIEIETKGEINLTITASMECSQHLDSVIATHVKAVFGIDLLPLDQRDSVCTSLDKDLSIMTSTCGKNGTGDAFKLMDIFRVTFLSTSCRDIQPIPRCLINFADEMFQRFTAAIGRDSKANICLEASIYIQSTLNFTLPCAKTDLKTYYEKSGIVADIAATHCPDKHEMIADFQCKRLGLEDILSGCFPNAISGCSQMPSDTCSAVTAKRSCLTKNAGSCLQTVPKNELDAFMNQTSICTYGSSSHSDDQSILSTSCSNRTYPCNVTKAIACIVNEIYSVNSWSNQSSSRIRNCLEDSYYCVTPLGTLIDVDSKVLASLLEHIKEFNPSWARFESKFIQTWLIISATVGSIFQKDSFVNLSSWDRCLVLLNYTTLFDDLKLKYPSASFPELEKSHQAIKNALYKHCVDKTPELLEPSEEKEDPACPVVTVKSIMDIMFSRVIFEFFSIQSPEIKSVCSLHNQVKQFVEATSSGQLNVSISLQTCSKSFKAEVSFTYKLASSILGKRCDTPDYDIPRCDYNKVDACVFQLVKNGIYLGKNQTVPGYCKIFEETKACVEKYSFKCDSCTMNSMNKKFDSVRKTAEKTCQSNKAPLPECQDKSKPKKCDIVAVGTCAARQFREMIKTDTGKQDKDYCRILNKNIDCIRDGTGGCTDVTPLKAVHEAIENINKSLTIKVCPEEKPSNNSVCQEGCLVNNASKCIDEFKLKIKDLIFPDDQQSACGYRNELKMCQAQYTKSCPESVTKLVLQNSDEVLLQLTQGWDECIDVLQTVKGFCDTAEQILNTQNAHVDSDNNVNDNNNSVEAQSTSHQTLNSLWLKAQTYHVTILKLLVTFEQEKRYQLETIVTKIWQLMEARCTDTRPLECYYCDGKNAASDCENKTEICPINKRACMFRQEYNETGVKYYAGCTATSVCKTDSDSESTLYCSSAKCNKKANAGNTCDLQPDTCKLEKALSCALNYFKNRAPSDTLNCTSSIADLQCMQKYSVGCSNSLNLSLAASELHLHLASTMCIVNAGPKDCVSLAMKYTSIVFESPYSNEGKAACVAHQQASASVRNIIESGNCSANATVSLKVMLQYSSSVVGSYCSDKCPEGRTDVALKTPQFCMQRAFDGIKKVSSCGSELQKADGDCGLAAADSLVARRIFLDCQMGTYVNGQIEALDSKIKAKCNLPTMTPLPEVCFTVCQATVVLTYIDEVTKAIQTHPNYSMWYLASVPTIFEKYTAGCTSIQQKDVVLYFYSHLGDSLNKTQETHPDFKLDFKLKADIYTDAATAIMSFKSNLVGALARNDTVAICGVINNLRLVAWKLPLLMIEPITSSTSDILKQLDKNNVCSVVGNDRPKRDAAGCQTELISKMIDKLLTKYSFETSPLDAKKQYCQDLDKSIEDAKKLQANCSDHSSLLTEIFNDSILIAEDRLQNFCIPLHYEKDQCNLTKVKECWKDFTAVSGCAETELDTLCRLARFTVECTYRFTTDCESVEDKAKAVSIRNTTLSVLTSKLGNNCTDLTAVFFCNATVPSRVEVCRLDEAQQCSKGIFFDVFKSDDTKYCQALAKNVSIGQSAASGCDADQITSIKWPVGKPSICNITDVTLNNVCQSLPACTVQPLLACFAQTIQSCSSLQTALACMHKYLSNNKQCQQYIGVLKVQSNVSTLYETTARTCNITFNFTVPQIYALAGFEKVVAAISVALKYDKTGFTAAEIVNSIFIKLVTTLSLTSYNPIAILTLQTLDTVGINKNGTVIVYDELKDSLFLDKDKCYMTRARACLQQQLLELFTVTMHSPDDINTICENWNLNILDVCLNDALAGCSLRDKNLFKQISVEISKGFAALGICDKPQVCLPSEASECNNIFLTQIDKYGDDPNALLDLCVGQLNAQECVNSFLSGCSATTAKRAMDDFKKLSDEVHERCKDVETPEPPLCPSIKGGRRVCKPGLAFTCLVNFNIDTKVDLADLITSRTQCFDIQKTMVCISQNITSCDRKNEDIIGIIESTKRLQASYGKNCPYLSEDMCALEPDCPVMTAGCDITMGQQISGNKKSVCDIKLKAEQCVENYTRTCTQAQKKQAFAVISKKMTQFGFPKDLSCQNGSIDPCLYSFVTSNREIHRKSNIQQNCALLVSQYDCIFGLYPNIVQSLYRDLAIILIDKLKTITAASQCSAKMDSTCTNPALANQMSILIPQLLQNNDFSDTDFCTKSQTILRGRKANDCYADLYDAIINSTVYKQKCANEKITCDVAQTNILACIKKIGEFSSLNCSDKQKAANCITQYLPKYCNYTSTWLNGTLCSENVVLQVSGEQGIKNFVSENGLFLQFGFYIVAGNRNITMKMTAQAKSESSTSSSQVKGVTLGIPQIHTGQNPLRLQDGSNEFKFNISATLDYIIDGDSTVTVNFIVTTYQVTINETTGLRTETALKSFTVSTAIVSVADADKKHSVCSSLNDPHIQTGDDAHFGIKFPGLYILYSHLEIPATIVVQTQTCSSNGCTCNCALMVYAGKSYFKLSVCDGSTKMTYKKGSNTIGKQQMEVYRENNLQRFHVVLLRTGTRISITNKMTYLQVFIQLTTIDSFKIRGLCGNFNNNTFDDLEMLNGTTYNSTEKDMQYDDFIPDPYVETYRISEAAAAAAAADPTALHLASVEQSDEDLEIQCYSWVINNTETSHCSRNARLYFNDVTIGEEQTLNLVALENQETSTASKKRKKRQAVVDDQPGNNTVIINPGKPVWNYSEATDFCMDHLFNEPLQACRDAIISLNDSSYMDAFDGPLKDCVKDLQLTGDPMWLQASRAAAIQNCQTVINRNPQLAKDLSTAFLNMRCDPFDCNGHGKCLNGLCHCDSGYVGTKCDVRVNELNKKPYLTLNQDDEAYLCEITYTSNCSSVFVSGGDFVSSDFLACHIREIEITETGVKNVPTEQVTIVKGELITTNQVRCDLGSEGYIKKTLEVSVSNDGKTPYEKYQTFIAFDPVCYDCNLYSCKKKKNVCIIGNRCVAGGESSVYSDCQYCNLTSPNTWSIRLDKPGCEDFIPKPPVEDTDKQTLTTALIAVGCSAVILVIILVTVCCIMKRRQKGLRRRAAQSNGSDNPGYHDMPFTGKPVTAYKSRQWEDSSVSPPTYNQYA